MIWTAQSGSSMRLCPDARNVIQIDQGDLLHAAARQRFGRPRPDAADSDHGHARGAQARMGLGAQQPGHAAESALEVGRRSGTGFLGHGAILDSGNLEACRSRICAANTGVQI